MAKRDLNQKITSKALYQCPLDAIRAAHFEVTRAIYWIFTEAMHHVVNSSASTWSGCANKGTDIDVMTDVVRGPATKQQHVKVAQEAGTGPEVLSTSARRAFAKTDDPVSCFETVESL